MVRGRAVQAKQQYLQEGKAKIADVGMAHIISDRAACQERLTQMGTLAWAAPELLVKGWE